MKFAHHVIDRHDAVKIVVGTVLFASGHREIVSDGGVHVGVIIGGQPALADQAVDVRRARAAHDVAVVEILQNHNRDVLHLGDAARAPAASSSRTAASAGST